MQNFRKHAFQGAAVLLASTSLTSFSAHAAGAATPAVNATTADADPDVDKGTGIAEGSSIVVTATTANEIAPVTASLTATQPQSIISRSLIEDSLPAAADFNQIASIAPSVSTINGTNGVGLSETKAVIRGFQDGEYNVTYDGVPFSDTNDPSHHSNTFFPSNTIETVIVDRGPGNASQLGQATFGGNINLFSRVARPEESVELKAAYGSFNTYLGRALLQSGGIDALGGTRFIAGGEYVRSDGRRTYSPFSQRNLFAKAVIPIGSRAQLSLLATANRNVFAQPDNDGVTLAQIAKFGKFFELTTDPTTQQYFGYNNTIKTTDFYIVRFQADIGAASHFDNTAYSYKYDNETLSANDQTSDNSNNRIIPGVTAAGKALPSIPGIPGYTKTNKYRVYGDIAKVRVDFGYGALTAGAWIEGNDTYRQQTDINLSGGGFDYREKAVTAPATGLNPGAVTPLYDRFNQNSQLNHTEEFVELELRPIEAVKITPGFKHVDFNRKIDATYNQTTRYAQRVSNTYTADLPFVTVNFQPFDDLSIYGQYAKGFLTPPLSQLYVASPSLSPADPQTSTNYQVGAVYHESHLSVDVDFYYIEFNNKFVSVGSGATAGFANIGGALYKGVEGQATYAFSNGLAVFANGSVNYARQTLGVSAQIAKAPFMTAAGGILYKHGPIRFSLIDKVVGAQYAANYGSTFSAAATANYRNYRIKSYHNAVLSASYDFGIIRAGVQVTDLFDSTSIANISGASNPLTDQYQFLPGRQISGEITVKF